MLLSEDMIILYLFIMLFIGFTTYIKFNTFLKPNMIVTILWCVLPGLSTLGLNGIKAPSLYTHSYFLSFLGIFNIIYLLFTKKDRMTQLDFNNIDDMYRYRLIYILNILSWIYMIPIILNAYEIISNYGFSAIRDYTFISSDKLVDGTQKFISQTIINAIFHATILLAMVNISLNKKTKNLTVFAIVDVIIYTFCFGGRFKILQLLVYYTLSNILIKKIYLNSNKKRMSIGFIIFILIIMIVTTQARGTSNFMSSMYDYYVMPFSFMDYILNNPTTFDLKHYLLGGGMLGFITEPIVLLLKVIFNSNLDIVSYFINISTQVFYEIAPGKYFNALTTIIYPFIRDFGYIGIIIGGALLSYFVSISENIFKKYKKSSYYCIYIFLVYVCFNSVLKYDLLSYGSTFTIIFIYIFSSGKKVNTVVK